MKDGNKSGNKKILTNHQSVGQNHRKRTNILIAVISFLLGAILLLGILLPLTLSKSSSSLPPPSAATHVIIDNTINNDKEINLLTTENTSGSYKFGAHDDTGAEIVNPTWKATINDDRLMFDATDGTLT